MQNMFALASVQAMQIVGKLEYCGTVRAINNLTGNDATNLVHRAPDAHMFVQSGGFLCFCFGFCFFCNDHGSCMRTECASMRNTQDKHKVHVQTMSETCEEQMQVCNAQGSANAKDENQQCLHRKMHEDQMTSAQDMTIK
jgi:hypothetical protein